MILTKQKKLSRDGRPTISTPRRFFVSLIVIMIGLSATVCCAEDKPVELTFTFWGSPFEKQAIEKAVASFNATHPTIHVNAQHTPYEAYGEKVSAMLAAGSPPDVAYLDFAQAFPFADGGKILDLTSYFAKQPRDQSVLETSFYKFDHGSKLMGTGLATGIILLYYNKSLFDEAKLPYPPAKADQAWTWDKFIEVAKKLTKDRNGNDAASPKFDPENIVTYGASIPQDWWGYVTFISSNGGKLVNDEGTKLLLNRPEDVEVLQALQDAIFVDHISPTPTQSKTLPSADILMQTGKVAMTFNGMWRVVDFSQQLDHKWGLGALPYFKEPKTTILSVPKVIFAATKHPEEAFVFYLYISDPTKVELFKTGLWAPLEKRYFTDPAKISSWLDGQPGVYPPEAHDVIIDYTLNHAAPPPPMYWLRNIDRITNEALNPALDELWTGKAKAQAVADQAVEKAKSLLQGSW
jgi:multiple sugar transport system substrate-binding protein